MTSNASQRVGQKLGFLSSLLLLSPVLIDLPEPLHEQYDPITHAPQISESRILEVSRILSEDIGFRTPGTREHALGEEWLWDQVTKMRNDCREIVRNSPHRHLECEIWHQKGSGSHRFDMMGARLYKNYVDLGNIVVRLSNGTDAGKEHSVLVNAHLDSTLPTPGRLTTRVLTESKEWEPKHAVVSVTAGTTGRELLFQATSKEMIEAYSHVPRPFGTIIANDVFSSGIILSDTDFRQFQQYLGVTGLDMAIVGNSYLYHMRKDVVENIQPGVAQNFAENTLALLLHYLRRRFTKPSTFWMYSFSTAKMMYAVLLVDAVILITATAKSARAHALFGSLATLGQPTLAVLSAFIGSLLGTNAVALVMRYLLGKPLSWFRNEYSAIVLYGPAAILVSLRYSTELRAYHATLLVQSFLALLIQLLGVGSAALFFLNAAIFGVRAERVSLLTYALSSFIPLFLGTTSAYLTLEVFVPLTGRIGADAPADNLIASIVSIVGASGFPLFVPFVLRKLIMAMLLATATSIAVFSAREPFDSMHQKRVYVLRTENITTGEHHLHLSTSDGAPDLRIYAPPITQPDYTNSSGDITPAVVGEIPIPEPVLMDWYNSDWGSDVPFSLPYKIPLPVDIDYFSQDSKYGFTLSAVDDVVDLEAGTRRLKLVIWHPGLYGLVIIAFDAHVLEWNLDDEPPNEHTRHHVKEASYYIPSPLSSPEAIQHASEAGKITEGMWPGKKSHLRREKRERTGLALKLFSDLDAWITKDTGGKVDALLLGCVAGVQRI
ncbi:hypothetical protein DFJ43DRAFT_1133193 [Lentinula guzmanii]|uniref:Peptide hydrolase n=1 Tax=Lentinula guzmanii TaxID=2804957 RepID=A0AA38MY10_9AGAR|nr:hypothetical protein DFJ43DRAFT_1133193 [Lentinula guzmanii]